jgi:myosin heavy chain 6/7
MHADLEDQLNELRASEENSKRAMADAARLAEELRHEQEHAGSIEKLRRTLEGQVKDLQARLDEAEASAMKGGRKIIQKLENRVRELEVELEAEQRRFQETDKTMRKQDRRLKEIALQSDEDHKAQDQFKDTIDKLQQKIKTYKRQVEEAEEIAAINLAKYRKVQHDLEECEQRADEAENAASKLRAKSRAGSSVTRTTSSSSSGPGGVQRETRTEIQVQSSRVIQQ